MGTSIYCYWISAVIAQWIINNSHLKIVAIVILILGILVALGFLNTIMPQQMDNRMVDMWEYQREGVGLILGAIWLWFGRKLK